MTLDSRETMLAVIISLALAIGITAIMDASGLAMFSALALFPLLLFFWWQQRCSREEIGWTWGTAQGYRWAVALPLIVVSLLVVAAAAFGAIDTSEANWNHALINLFAGAASTALIALITEEGFFRGWLWAGLRRKYMTPAGTIIATSLAFTAWHLSWVFFDPAAQLPWWQLPIYLVNATLIGICWGLMRQLSGSILVPSLSHGIWNGMVYALFGFGPNVGALGIEATWLFGPEVGLLGIVLNGAFAIWMWRAVFRPDSSRVEVRGLHTAG